MFFTADQLLAHLIGDYLLQSHWMATRKRTAAWVAAVHAITYTLPFLFLTHDPYVLMWITGTHFIIDHYGLARYVIWAKNHLSPPSGWVSWRQCNLTGFSNDDPQWLTTWLLIITDNTLHLICNALALYLI